MKKLPLILILTFLLSACSTNNSTPQTVEPVSCSSIAKQPASSVPVLNIELPCADGKSSVFLNEIKGPAVINAWASWCDPCREEIPIFKEFAQLSSGTIQIVGIDVEERNLEDGINFASEMGMSWPQLFDRDGRTKAAFGMGIPVTWLINDQGQIVYEKVGPIRTIDQMKDLVQHFLQVQL